MHRTESTPKTEYVISAALAIGSFTVYAATLAPTVLFADGGEFQFVPWLPGIAHPTGYPLYVLLGWLFSHMLPVGEVAWRLNLFSAVTGAVAVAMGYLLAQRMVTVTFPNAPNVALRLSAAAGALTFAFGQTFWSQAIIAEVYSLHALFVAVVLWVALRLLPNHTGTARTLTFKSGAALAFIFGLSLTHHRTMVLMLPALLLGLWLGGWRRVSLRDGIKVAAVFVLPGTLYLYLPLIVPHVPYTQIILSPTQTLTLYQNTLSGFVTHIMGSVFSADVQPTGVGVDRLLLSVGFLRQQVGWVGAGLGLVGLYHLRKYPALLWVTLGSFVGFLAFNWVYFVGDVYVLFIPCWLILSLWIGVGIMTIATTITRAIIVRKQARLTDGPIFSNAIRKMETRIAHILTVGLVSLGLTLPLTLLITRYNEVNQHQNTIARDAWQEILTADLPQNAILLSNDRNELMPMWYYQLVQHRRPDLLGVFPLITPNPKFANVGRVLDQAFASQRPVYLIKPMDGLALKANFTLLPPLPHAQLVKATPIDSTAANAVSLAVGDGLSVTGYTITRTTTVLTIDVYWRVGTTSPSQNYTSFVHLVDSTGNGITQSDHRPGGVYYPPRLWQPGETLRDRHTLSLPGSLAPGQYTLTVGLYTQPQPGTIQLAGTPQTLTTLSMPQ